MEKLKIRTASERDIPVILDLLYDLGRPKQKKDSDVDVFRRLVKKHLKDSDKKILVAEIDDVEIVGLVCIIFSVNSVAGLTIF